MKLCGTEEEDLSGFAHTDDTCWKDQFILGLLM